MAKTTRSRLTEVRVRTATADYAKHGRQLFDGLGSNGLYLHVTPAGAKCWVQQLMVPNAATGKSRRVRIGLGAWPRVTLALARKATFANRCLRDEGCDPLAAKATTPAAKRPVAAALGAQAHRTEHHRTIPYAEVGQAIAAVHARSRRPLPRLACSRGKASALENIPLQWTLNPRFHTVNQS